MRTIIAVPARFGSTRLPGKPLEKIDGEAMVVRVWRRCLDVPGVDAVLVATDDERVRDVVRKAGGEAVMTSPGHRSGTDRIAEAVRGRTCDLLVNVQGDEAFLEAQAIAALMAYFRGGGSAPAATLAAPLKEMKDLFDPSVVKVLIAAGGNALYFSRYPIPYRAELWRIEGGSWEGSEEAAEVLAAHRYYAHVGIYAYRPSYLKKFVSLAPTPGEEAEKLEQLRALESGMDMHVVVTPYHGFGVDTPEDLDRARTEALRKP